MQIYYQFYWEKKDGENIKILRVFGESEEAVIPDTIEGYAVTETGDYCFAASAHLKTEYEHTVCILSIRRQRQMCIRDRSVSMTRRKKHGRKCRQIVRTGACALWNLAGKD